MLYSNDVETQIYKYNCTDSSHKGNVAARYKVVCTLLFHLYQLQDWQILCTMIELEEFP